jgi:MFS superfamily sulfate permease-like transporter
VRSAGLHPDDGVIVRSSANIEAGGRTRGSAIFHGIWLLAAVSLLPWLLNLIPTTSLAAILVFTGFKLVSPKAIRLLRQYGKSEVAIYAATVIAIVTTDLLKGVLFGLALSLGKLIYTFSHLEVKMISNQPIGGQMTMELRGAATFVRLPKLAAALESVPEACICTSCSTSWTTSTTPASIFSPTGRSSTKPVAAKSSWSGTSYTGNISTAVPWPPVGVRQLEDVPPAAFSEVTQRKGTDQ